MKDLVSKMGFESLLGMKKCNLRRDLIFLMVYRFDPVDTTIDIGQGKIVLTSDVFGKIIGLVDSDEEIPVADCEEMINSGGNSSRISPNELQSTLERKT